MNILIIQGGSNHDLPSGEDTVILSDWENLTKEHNVNIEYIENPKGALKKIFGLVWSFDNYARLNFFLDKYSPDVVHFHTVTPYLSLSVLYAAKKFNEAETLFPQSEWAPKSALMAAYAYYTQDYYSDTIAELERFIRVYPLSKNLDYVYYLLGISYYEQIVDEKKDLQSIIKAKEYFKIVSKNYPNTNYSLDAEYKIDLVNDTLASKEMYIGRYYFDKKKWIPAINRFRTVIDDYETTIYAQEALHRLVEVHYILGLKDEAKKYFIFTIAEYRKCYYIPPTIYARTDEDGLFIITHG